MKTEEFMTYLNAFWSEFNLHPIWLFTILFSIAMSKSTVVLSSFLPPASVMLLTGITASLPKLNISLVGHYFRGNLRFNNFLLFG